MKLFNKTIDRQLFKQYPLGSDLSKQEVVVKIFNPQGAGTWFILNSDPEDPDYLWAIVDLGYGAEVGSVSRSELENYRGRFGLGFERDLSFDPVNALELYQGLRNGEFYKKGGNVSRDRKFLNHGQKHEVRYSKGKNRKGYGYADGGLITEEKLKQEEWFSPDMKIMYQYGNGRLGITLFYGKDRRYSKKTTINNTSELSLKELNLEVKKEIKNLKEFAERDLKRTYADGGNIEKFSDNQRMIMNQNVEVEHHHEELEDILEDQVEVPAWVVAKMETATQNLSDITHYLDGQKEIMEDRLEGKDDDDEIENKEVVEPINVSAGTKSEMTKNFTDNAWGNLRGFLKGMEGIDLRDDYTFDYKGEQFEVEPIINSDENGVSNAVFTIFDGDGEEVGEVAYSGDGGKQKFTANSEFFSWNNTKFEDGGYFDGTIPNVSTYMSTYAKGGEIYSHKHSKDWGEDITIELIEPTAKGWKVKQTTKKGRKAISKSAFFTNEEIAELFEKQYSKGGEIAKAEILGLSKNIMGTTSIEMKISGMRKPQDFSVYPISAEDESKIITIQSSTRIGRIDLKTGRGVMSQSHQNGAYFVHFQMDKLIPFMLSESDLEDLKSHIFKTAGDNVGSRGIVSDNSGASRIFANGGGIGFIPMDLEETLHITAKWGGTDIKGVIGILNAMIDSGLTDEDLKPKPTKSGSAHQNAVARKTKEIWAKIEPNYKGDLKGNMYYSTISRLVSRSGTSDDVLKRFKPFRKYQKDTFADGGGLDDGYNLKDINGEQIEVGDTVRTTQPSGGLLNPANSETGIVEKTKDAFGQEALQIRYRKQGTNYDRFILLNGKINEIVKKSDSFANGGGVEKIRWQDVEKGDSARVKELNKMGLITHTYGRKFNLKFPNGAEKTFDASELEFFKLEKDQYEIDDHNNYANGGNLKKYILKADIKTVTVKRNGKEVTYKGADVLNGANVLAKGGDISSKANYVPKRDVVGVELKDGTTVKPANGYWIKKGAEPVGAEPTSTSSASSEPKIGITEIRKDARGNWRAETTIDNFNGYDWRLSTIKTYSGNLVSSAQGGKTEATGSKGVSMFIYTLYQDPNHTLEVSKPKRLTDKVVEEQHDKALAKFKKFMETGMFKGGGKISNFDKLSAKVAKQYEGKPVKGSYQEEYGKYYSKEEAQEVGDKVAGKVKAMQADKKAFGGLFGGLKSKKASKSYADLDDKMVFTKDGKAVQVVDQLGETLLVIDANSIGTGVPPRKINISEIDPTSYKKGGVTKKRGSDASRELLIKANNLAKEIRKDGESWLDAKKRAFAQLKK